MEIGSLAPFVQILTNWGMSSLLLMLSLVSMETRPNPYQSPYGTPASINPRGIGRALDTTLGDFLDSKDSEAI